MPDSQFFSMTLRDSTEEVSSFALTIQPVTALNLATILTQTTDFEEALDAIILGDATRKSLSAFDNTYNPADSTNTANQKELKWLCHYHAVATGKKYVVRIPTADLSLLPTVNGKISEDLVLSGGVGLAFKTAFDTLARDPNNPNGTVALDRVQFVSGK